MGVSPHYGNVRCCFKETEGSGDLACRCQRVWSTWQSALSARHDSQHVKVGGLHSRSPASGSVPVGDLNKCTKFGGLRQIACDAHQGVPAICGWLGSHGHRVCACL